MSFRPTQYNSPVRLYSPENVSEALNKQTRKLRNGAVGIDFHQLAKPTNLANSAVLRMLEEEERSGRGSDKRIYDVLNSIDELNFDLRELRRKPKGKFKWPPPDAEHNYSQRKTIYKTECIMKPGVKLVAWPPPPPEDSEVITEEGPVYSQGPPRGQGQTLARPSQYHPPHQFEPPPSTITLRSSAPFNQAPPPVFMSQPATATHQGGHRMRGDDKWPPEDYKQQAAAENEARLAIAKGPAFRPRKIQKDYSSFFAQNALNSTYPGYRAPPGTQHYIEEGTSNL
ncbi:uncharacterized protein LOC142322079 isoform X2 [Lycorma delicatula]